MTDLTTQLVSKAVNAAALDPIDDQVAEKLANYGNLLLKWSKHTNLTAISDAQGILQRHLVESVAAAQALPQNPQTLLDYGSGAGLPGIPIAICRPEIQVTLAESQSKKVTFLREAVRGLKLTCSVYSGRVESMPLSAQFGTVTMRAVDRMEDAVVSGLGRVSPGGWLVLFATEGSETKLLKGRNCKTLRRIPLPTIGHLVLLQP